MAKKKTVTTTEEIEETPPEEIDYKKDIEGKSLEQVATETPKEETKPEKEEKVEEEVKEEIEKVDVEAISKKVAEETAQKTRLEIADLLKGEVKTEEVDEYEKWANDLFEKEGKQPTWKQAAEFIKEKAKSEIIAEANRVQQDYQAKQAETVKSQGEEVDRINKSLDSEIDELYTNNKLTKIKDKEDQNDPGIIERKALFKTMLDVNLQRQSQGLDPILSVSRIYTNYFKRPNSQPAGADAMMISNAGTSPAGDDDEIDYFRDVKSGGGWRGAMKSMFRGK